jgi:hypothetical protein
MRHRLAVLVLATAAASSAYAETVEPPPPPGLEAAPDGAPTQDELAPEITIVEKPQETVEEYRLNGQLYMIKVKPKKGPEYFLVDADGDGQLESRRNQLDPKFLVPSWMILRW